MKSCLLVIIFSLSFGKIDFTKHDINISDNGIISLHSAEINGDGNTDLIYSSIENNSITWLENKGNGNFESHIISSKINGSISIFPSDLNRDGKMDIVSASMYDNQINWYKNNGNGEFSKQFDV